MPKELTHWMLAERAFKALPAGMALRETIDRHRAAYLGGAVLPDTLAHIFRGPFHPVARQLGHRFHDAADNSYLPLIETERRFPDGLPPELFSCLLGVISHMEADVVLHPWVYAATGEGGMGEHYRLETAIDVHFVSRGEAPAKRKLGRLLTTSAREALVEAAGHLFDPEGALPREALEQALALHCRFQSMYDSTRWKLAVRVLGALCGSPFKEQRHLFYPLLWPAPGKPGDESEPWPHPESGELMNDSLEDLAGEAVDRTVALFLRIEQAGSLVAALSSPPGPNLLTGLHGVKKA